jgi:hypothetical protein
MHRESNLFVLMTETPPRDSTRTAKYSIGEVFLEGLNKTFYEGTTSNNKTDLCKVLILKFLGFFCHSLRPVRGVYACLSLSIQSKEQTMSHSKKIHNREK